MMKLMLMILKWKKKRKNLKQKCNYLFSSIFEISFLKTFFKDCIYFILRSFDSMKCATLFQIVIFFIVLISSHCLLFSAQRSMT